MCKISLLCFSSIPHTIWYAQLCNKQSQKSFYLTYFKVQAREREVQQTKDVKEDFSCRLQDIEAKLKTITLKLEDKRADLAEAKEETKVIQQTD